jgi:phage shock protein PspC (stress-responsive transcriptional regulator)/predicted membrane protein
MSAMNDTVIEPPPAAAGPPPPLPPPPRRLMRSTSDRKAAGVCGGVGEYLGVDPTVVRLGFVVATFIGGLGLVTYLVAWLILPTDDGTGGVQGGGRMDRNTTIAVLLLLAALAIGVASPIDGGFVIPLVLIAGGIYLLMQPAEDAASGAQAATTPSGSSVPPPYTSPQPAASPGAEPLRPVTPRPPRPTPVVTAAVASLLALVVAGSVAIDQAGWADVSVTDAMAVMLGVIGCGLLVGAVVGRATGLIVLGLFVGAAIAPARVADEAIDDGVGERRYAPTTIEDLRAEYRLGMGEIVLDLRELDLGDTTQKIDLRLGFGQIDVIVPEDVTVIARMDVDAGNTNFFGTESDGWGVDVGPVTEEASNPDGTVELDLEVGFGQARIRRG